MENTKWYKCMENLPETTNKEEIRDRDGSMITWFESETLLLCIRGEKSNYYETGIFERSGEQAFFNCGGMEYDADSVIAWKHIEPFEEELQDAERN